MTANVIGEGANEWARDEAAGHATEGEQFGVLVFAAATWTTDHGFKRVIPSWFACVTLDVDDKQGLAHCEHVAQISPNEPSVREAVADAIKVLRYQRDHPAAEPVIPVVTQPEHDPMDSVLSSFAVNPEPAA